MPHDQNSSSRRWAFVLGMVLIPVAFFAVVEIALRLLDYGENLGLMLKTTWRGEEYYVLNPAIGRRYFPPGRFEAPRVYEDRFLVRKQPNSLRVFCLGASTTAGFPFEYQLTPASKLRDQLELAYPERQIEVVNVGITATNSFTVADLVDELLEYEPDALVLSMGQNEFYGAYGVSSSLSLGRSRTLIQWYLKLQQVKIVQLLRNVISSLRGPATLPGQSARKGTLMEQMVGEQLVPYGSTEYRTAMEWFGDNCRSILRTAGGAGIPVVVSTLVTNERDLPPFRSIWRTDLTEEAKKLREELMQRGTREEQEGSPAQALALYRDVLILDSLAAAVHFRIGKCLDAMDRADEARLSYQRARDLDALRFRASGELNTMIRSIVEEEGAILADVDSAFRDHCSNGVLGSELLLEHVHPNERGYALMGEVWGEAIMTRILPNVPHTLVSREAAEAYTRATELDAQIGHVRIAMLMQQWPFQETSRPYSLTLPASIAEETAYEYLRTGMPWNQAHYRAADRYAGKKEWNAAHAEYAAVQKVVPEDAYALMRMGDMSVQASLLERAESEYRRALAIQEDPFTLVRIGMLALQTHRPAEAVAHLRKSLSLNERAGSAAFTERDRREAMFLFALALAQSGMIEEARSQLRSLLMDDPSHVQGQELLRKLPR